MKKQVYKVAAFLVGAPIFIFLCVTGLAKTVNEPSEVEGMVLPVSTNGQVLAAITEETNEFYPQLSGTFGKTDARVHLIKNYLMKYSSPLTPFAQELVDAADKYSLDYRLLPAIARQESNLCKVIPENSYNCWGFGIYGDRVTRFDNYPQAIDTVAKTLKRKYIDVGLETPEQIMAKYTPPSLEKGGPWAKAVNKFLLDLE